MHESEPPPTNLNSLGSLGQVQRNERVRLVAQMLRDLGFSESVDALLRESGVVLESADATRLRQLVLDGNWDAAESLVSAICSSGGDAADRLKDSLFAIRLQKFLELLEANKPKEALLTLRSEISLVCSDHSFLHKLSSLMMCSSIQDVKRKADWDGANGRSRTDLLTRLQNNLSSGTMLPENRLETLLSQAIEHQKRKCLYHNIPTQDISLLNDHCCSRSSFPGKCRQVLDGHSDEVWFVAFSPNGQYLASASKDCTCIIWDATTFKPVHVLRGHSDHVSVLAWSSDSAALVTGSNDNSIKLWNVQTGTCSQTFALHTESVTSLAFIPGSTISFVSSSVDKNILLWSVEGHVLHKWNGVRVTDLNITSDGKKMVTISDKRVRVFDLVSKEEIASLQEHDAITSICVAQNGRFALVNVSACQEIHLWDMEENRVLRKFMGHKQSRFVIRSTFGGLDQNFVLSGSEDSNIYVWNREHGVLLESLEGHTATVNSISWNTRLNIFASASDDRTIRIWGCP
ncbi:hypothetical protein HDU79_006404 [Rhizoclosmatium sp. JEL0117]|nr:hypothetical protein HDU79_006404 [Rhizoclosmatium sp. JEL0117]